MTLPCDQLQLYVDGELAENELEAFNEHLPGCAGCRAELHQALQLRALELQARTVSRRDRLRPKRNVWVPVAFALAAAAAVVIWLGARPAVRPEAPVELALATARPIEGRISHPAADRHRPYSVARSGATGASDAIPLATLAALEKRGDLHGVAAAYLLMGDRGQAAAYLGRSPAGADVSADRALILLGEGKPEAALLVVDELLRASPRHPQALWNRALALRDLGLTLMAAEAFEAVAALGEPGWAAEAKERADGLARPTREQGEAYLKLVTTDGPRLSVAPDAISSEAARRFPGPARIFLYDAVRSAPSAERVRALLPLARELDAVAGGTDLVRYVERIAGADFGRRKPLAERYAEVIAGKRLTPAESSALLASLRRGKQDDILLGAIVRTSPGGKVPPALLPEFRALAAATADRWFDLMAIEQEGRARAGLEDHAGVEQVLAPALAACSGNGWEYRCAYIALHLGESRLAVLRPPEAKAALLDGLRRARRIQEWGIELGLLPLLADAASLSDDVDGETLPLVRAYVGEWTRRKPSCDNEVWGAELTAMVLMNRLDLEGARTEMRRAEEIRPTCAPARDDDQAIFVLANVLRDRGTPEEVAALRERIAKLRAGGTLSPGKRALLDHSEGRLLIDREPEAARALLARSIAAGDGDDNARRARAYSYSVLVLEAGKAQDWPRALELLAEEMGGTAPQRCVLGLAVEDRRALTVARGADGTVVGQYSETRTQTQVDSSSLVSASVRTGFSGCEEVAVLARAPLHGRPELLPADLAWSYRSGRPARADAVSGRRIVIADVEPPAASGLARVGAWRSREAPDLLVSGAAATPARTLAEMKDAGFIEIHAHGLVDLAISDASFLALSPDADGRYALTAADIRRQKLRGEPVVILGACHAARAASYHHRPWSLATAFIEAGARAVVASPDEIQDADAGRFFDELRDRIRRGQSPAVALRDQRREWMSSHPGSDWVKRLMVFQ